MGGKVDTVGNDDPHHFEFDLDRGIREQLVEKLEASPFLDLVKNVGPKRSGVYALYYEGRLIYVGKAVSEMTKSKRTLRARLNEHVSNLSKRRNLTMADMKCRYLTCDSAWWTFAAEFALLAHYEPELHRSGIGSKVPGVGRPGTERVSKFDARFPRAAQSSPPATPRGGGLLKVTIAPSVPTASRPASGITPRTRRALPSPEQPKEKP